jgi:hypothetical protein
MSLFSAEAIAVRVRNALLRFQPLFSRPEVNLHLHAPSCTTQWARDLVEGLLADALPRR